MLLLSRNLPLIYHNGNSDSQSLKQRKSPQTTKIQQFNPHKSESGAQNAEADTIWQMAVTTQGS